MKELYNERNVIVKSWADFLELPKTEGYINNSTRVANHFSDKVIDEAGDPYTTIENCLAPQK